MPLRPNRNRRSLTTAGPIGKEGADTMLSINVERKLVWSNVMMLLCLLMAGIFLLPKASGDEFDKKTIVTFSSPVQIPRENSACWHVRLQGFGFAIQPQHSANL